MGVQQTKKVVGVDFDDVLLDFTYGLIRFHNERYGTTIGWEDHSNVNLWEVWNCSKEESIERVLEFYEHELHFQSPPIEKAVEAIGELAKKYSVIVVTSRPDYVREKTLEWLYKHFPKEHFEDICFTNLFAGKGEVKRKSHVCEERGIEIFIEDFVHNAEDIASIGKKVLLFDKPWNRNAPEHPKIRRVHSWPEILEVIEDEFSGAESL